MPNYLLSFFTWMPNMHLEVYLSKTKFCITPKFVPHLAVPISVNASSILPLAQAKTLEASLTLVFLSHLMLFLVGNPASSDFKVYAGSDYPSPPLPLTYPVPRPLIASFMDHCIWSQLVPLLPLLSIYDSLFVNILSVLKPAKVTFQFRTFQWLPIWLDPNQKPMWSVTWLPLQLQLLPPSPLAHCGTATLVSLLSLK